MPTLPFILFSFFIMLLTIGCAKVETDKSDSSNLNGVWKIEHSPNAKSSVISYRNVLVSDDKNGVKISNCKASEELSFIRDEEYLINSIGGSLRIVTGDLIESASVPSVILLRKTSKSDFFNAGSIEISSETYGDFSTNTDVCVQRIVTDEDEPDYYHFHLSFPYKETFMEMDIEYAENRKAKLRNARSFVLTSPIFIDTLRSNTAIATSGQLILNSVTDSSAHFTFNLTSLNNRANFNNSLPGPKMSGSFKVNY